MTNYKLSLNPRGVARMLIAGEVILLLCNALALFFLHSLGRNYVYGFVPLFYFDEEANVQTFFSVLLLLSAAALLTAISRLEKTRGAWRMEWVVLAGGFLLMAFDEAFSVHEQLVAPMQALLGSRELGLLYYAWVIPGMVLSLVLGMYFIGFLRSLPAITARRFLVAGALYLGGAIGFELLGGARYESSGRNNFVYSLYATIEESLEMAGVICFIWALLDYCRQTFTSVQLAFTGSQPMP